MTLNAAPVRVVYAGAGTTDTFAVAKDGVPITFRDTAHIYAVEVDADGIETDVTWGVEYDIAGGPDDGVLTRLGGNLPAGYKLAIWRQQPISQDTDFSNGGDFSSEDHEDTYDKIVEMLQELDDRVTRSLKVPAYINVAADMEIPAGASNIPVVDTVDGEVSAVEPADLGGDGGTPLSASAFGTAFIQETNAANARDALELGDLATQDAVTQAQIATAHAATSHDTLIRAYNQGNGQTVRQDIGIWAVESATTTTPPTVVNGAAYLIPASGATGAWATNANKIAHGESGAWVYYTASEGFEARAKDTDLTYYFDGSAWVQSGGSTSSSGSSTATVSDLDGRVVGIGKSNGNTLSGGEWGVCWTIDQRILVTGDQSVLGHDIAGDTYTPFEIEWDRVNNGTIEAIYVGHDYLIVQTDQTTGNLWSMGLNTKGQLGHGDTTLRRVPTRIVYFQTTNPVRISSVVTEQTTGVANDRFWFAIDTAGAAYACGSGTNYTQGNGATADVTTPAKLLDSGGVTPLASITEITCASTSAPVFARTSGSTYYYWGSGTSGASGKGAATDTTRPTLSGNANVTKAVVTGGALTSTRAASAIIQAGVVKVAGTQAVGAGGIGLGAPSGVDQTSHTTVSGTLASRTATDIVVAGGDLVMMAAIDSLGDIWLCGYGGNNIYGAGAASNDNGTFTRPTLPATMQSTVTISNASPGVVTWSGHKFKNGDRVRFTTSGALPTGLAVDTVYYVVSASISAGTFSVATTAGGTAINTSSAGSGTHTGYAFITKAKIGGLNGTSAVYLEVNGRLLYAIGYDTNCETGKSLQASTAATRTWDLVLGQLFDLADWQLQGTRAAFGIRYLTSIGTVRYAGYNAQGQGGVLNTTGTLHSVPTLQPVLMTGARTAKEFTGKGAYSSGTSYSRNDIVLYTDGNLYRYTSTTAASGNAPTDTTRWELFLTGGVAEHTSTVSTDRTGTDVNTAQSVFDSAIDAVTLAANSTYAFDAFYVITRAAGTTSHTTAVLFGGTAVVASIDYLASVTNPTGGGLAAVQQIVGNAATAVVLTAANTSATEHVVVRIMGTIRTGAAGTLIPQFQYSAAPGGAPTVKRGSFFRLKLVGADTFTASSLWS